jgi:polar amino acid transport system ATP-binding protein
MLKLQNIKKSFKEKMVLNNINTEFKPNKITVITGPSGEGKSTLFRIITNLIKQDEGTIVKDDHDSIGMVFQNNALYPHYNVLNNLVVPQKVILRRKKSVAIQKSLETLKILDIDHLAYKKIATLSGGESQRVAIARSLVMDNNILLLDEPTSALDYENTKKLVDLLEDLKAICTIIIITHDTLFAEMAADYQCELRNGVLTYSDSQSG